MIQSVINVFKIPELRKKILFTLLMLVIYRAGMFTPIPGTDTRFLSDMNAPQEASTAGGGVSTRDYLDFIAQITGGRFGPFLFSLGTMPYISASIILQLLTQAVPSIQKLAKEGETGRRKINEYTRYLTVLLCIIQAFFIINAAAYAGHNSPGWRMGSISPGIYRLVAITATTAGTVFLMWLGELVDEFGIGNGISLIIMAGIVDRLPSLIYDMVMRTGSLHFNSFMRGANGELGIETILIIVVMFVGIVFGVIMITQAQRRIPIQQAKHTRGRRTYGGQRQYLPLRVNLGGVIPVIFASSLLYLPMYVCQAIGEGVRSHWPNTWAAGAAGELATAFSYGNVVYELSYVALIFLFCYFWTAIQFQPKEMADNLRDWGSFVPGMRPGRRTAEYLERVMNRITYIGAYFLAVVAIIPSVVQRITEAPGTLTGFLGGTSLLIIVSVALDLVQRIESHLIMRHYEGFLAEGRVRGRQG